MLIFAAHPIVHVNASLNTVATLLLIAALFLVKRGYERAHMRVMQAAILVSAAFLCCYVYYHSTAGHVPFEKEGPIRTVYYTILITHILLAITVPYFALRAAYLGLRAMNGAASEEGQAALEFRRRHKALVRWAYPIWLYVSVTGVLIYLMLYHL